jgi:hypothetical protein
VPESARLVEAPQWHVPCVEITSNTEDESWRAAH